MNTPQDMIRPYAEAADAAKKALLESGISREAVERLQTAVNDKVKAVHAPIVAEAGREYEETWDCVDPEDPTILAAADDFIGEEAIADAVIVEKIRTFVRKHALFHQQLGFYSAPSLDFD